MSASPAASDHVDCPGCRRASPAKHIVTNRDDWGVVEQQVVELARLIQGETLRLERRRDETDLSVTALSELVTTLQEVASNVQAAHPDKPIYWL
jgi:hypothetical protein